MDLRHTDMDLCVSAMRRSVKARASPTGPRMRRRESIPRMRVRPTSNPRLVPIMIIEVGIRCCIFFWAAWPLHVAVLIFFLAGPYMSRNTAQTAHKNANEKRRREEYVRAVEFMRKIMQIS